MKNIALLTKEAYTAQGISHLNEVVESIPRNSSDNIYVLFEQDITVKPGVFGFGNSVHLHPREYSSQTNVDFLVELAEAISNAHSPSDKRYFKDAGINELFPQARGVRLDRAYIHAPFNKRLEEATRHAHPQLFTHEKQLPAQDLLMYVGKAPEIKNPYHLAS
ncbi:MAG: hypothetical protein ACMXYD_02150 [Candidatus Woesearchaeota archaeon]